MGVTEFLSYFLHLSPDFHKTRYKRYPCNTVQQLWVSSLYLYCNYAVWPYFIYFSRDFDKIRYASSSCNAAEKLLSLNWHVQWNARIHKNAD